MYENTTGMGGVDGAGEELKWRRHTFATRICCTRAKGVAVAKQNTHTPM